MWLHRDVTSASSIFVFQVSYPKLGGLCWLVIPCGLTTLDHWSPLRYSVVLVSLLGITVVRVYVSANANFVLVAFI
jgi:hypothetical protein